MMRLQTSELIFSGIITIYILSRLLCTNIQLADPLDEVMKGEILKSNDDYLTKKTKIVAIKVVNAAPLDQFGSIKIPSNLINKLISPSVALSVA